MSSYGYTPYRTTNAGWGAAATYAKAATDRTRRQGGVYTPTNPGWGAGSSQVPSYMPKVVNVGGGAAQPNYRGVQAPSYDWQGDPVLMEVRAMAGKNRADAKASTDDALRKSILQSGISTLAEKLFGSDTAFIQSVKDAPFSGMGQIRNAYEGVSGLVNQTNEDLNRDNLFFSSYRTNEALPQVFRQRQQDEFDLTNQTQSSIDSINAAYANRLEEIRMQEVEAERQAQWEAMMRAMMSGGGGPSSSGGGGDTSPAAYNAYVNSLSQNGLNPAGVMSALPYDQWAAQQGGGSGGGGGGGGTSGWWGDDPGFGREAVVPGLTVSEPYDRVRGGNIRYQVDPSWPRDPDGGGYIAPNGARIDWNGLLR